MKIVEAKLQHFGPVVYWRPGEERAETTLRILELFSAERLQLVLRKTEKMEDIRNEIERAVAAKGTLRELLFLRLRKLASVKAEYSAMVLSILETLVPGDKWR
jgi:hypothetical protein